jgi:hypothetical protein
VAGVYASGKVTHARQVRVYGPDQRHNTPGWGMSVGLHASAEDLLKAQGLCRRIVEEVKTHRGL